MKKNFLEINFAFFQKILYLFIEFLGYCTFFFWLFNIILKELKLIMIHKFFNTVKKIEGHSLTGIINSEQSHDKELSFF